jgi:hypothetical protein
VSKDLAINSIDHPWTDGDNHDIQAAAARRVAGDIAAHERWGPDRQPVYDPQDCHYVGDDSDDSVRCQTDMLRMSLPRGHQQSQEEIADAVYRALLNGTVDRYEALYAEVVALVARGVLTADEPVGTAVDRLMANGYTAQDLRSRDTRPRRRLPHW